MMLRSGRTVMDIVEAAELSEEALVLYRPQRAARDYVVFLVRNRLFDDAVAFLANVLPRREAVWWAWSCARDVSGEPIPPKLAAVLEATRRWIVEPTEEHRRAAGDAAEADDYESPAAFAAFAAFLCGDTIGPADAPPAPAPPGAVAQAITGCVCMAAAEGDPAKTEDRFSAFIARAMERADKGNVWAAADTAGPAEGS